MGLIDSAVTAVKGDLTDKEGMRKEMEKADFKSVRGDFKFGNNHIPIQNFYLQDAVKNADGSYSLHTVATIVKDRSGQVPRQMSDEVGTSGCRYDATLSCDVVMAGLCPGHPRLLPRWSKTWMPATRRGHDSTR